MPFSAFYRRVPLTEHVEFDERDEKDSTWYQSTLGRRKPLSTYIFLSVLVLSVLLNAVALVFFMEATHCTLSSSSSRFAGLQRNLTKSWTYHGLYDSGNGTMTDEAWENINIDAGNVALDSSYAEEMELPKAQDFPWDRSKGIYYLNGYHNLHCLKEIRLSYNRFRAGLPQNLDVSHILHCFDSLRQDILCNADDVPRYSGFQPSGSTGRGQKRQCRDWNQLEEWANANTACWRYIQDSTPDFHLIEQYKFCPPESPYAAAVAEVFGSNSGK